MLNRLSNYSFQQSWVTIGSFDGVHLGHQALIHHLVDGAHQAGAPAVVLTFSPHPAVFFNRVPLAYSLTSPEERKKLLESLGVDQVIQLEFDAELANLSAVEFMDQMKEYLGISHLLVGFNFALGKNRNGDVPTLQILGKERGIEVEVISPIIIEGENISSSQIRSLLQNQQIKEANRCLGRPYSLSGDVIHGEARGTRLGFPTANINVPADRLIPGNGVYVTRARVNGDVFQSVTNIGIRPTFDHPLPAPRVEPHLLDVHEDFYSQHMTLEFIEFLRPEIRFPDSQSLIDQINRDVQRTREVLAHDA